MIEWIRSHPEEAVAALLALLSAVNGMLAHSPRLVPWLRWLAPLLALVDRMSVTVRRDSPGSVKLPLAASQPPGANGAGPVIPAGAGVALMLGPSLLACSRPGLTGLGAAREALRTLDHAATEWYVAETQAAATPAQLDEADRMAARWVALRDRATAALAEAERRGGGVPATARALLAQGAQALADAGLALPDRAIDLLAAAGGAP